MKPSIPLTDSRFVYTSSTHTDIRARFDRVRAELDAKKQPASKVRQLTDNRKGASK